MIVTILVFWVTQFGTLTLARYIRFPDQGLDFAIPRAIVSAAGLAVSFGILFVHGQARRASLPFRALVALSMALVGCNLHGLVNEIVFANLHSSTFNFVDYFVSVLDWFWFYLALSVVILVFDYGAELVDSRVQIESLKTQSTLAHLSALRYQLNPHFLFNTLNSIGALIEERQPDEAQRMINRLSDFLRAGLDSDPLDEVPLIDELAQQRRYLEIERIRFPERLAFEVDVDRDVADALVPSLILQPLVENAIKYGVAPSSGRVAIAIEARKSGDKVLIVVRDDGRPQAAGASGAGIGLHNVRERLNSRFGAAASVAAGPLDGGGYAVTLTLPLKHP